MIPECEQCKRPLDDCACDCEESKDGHGHCECWWDGDECCWCEKGNCDDNPDDAARLADIVIAHVYPSVGARNRAVEILAVGLRPVLDDIIAERTAELRAENERLRKAFEELHLESELAP